MTGIICLNKPEGITSFLALKKTKRVIGEKKAGHCGTLDPMATGVLPVMVGGATRFLPYLPVTPKKYVAVMEFGYRTNTLDRTGEVTEKTGIIPEKEDIIKVLNDFRGEIMQVPPMYSAIKKNGVRMYDLARQGIEVEREARPATIYSLELLDSETGKPGEYRLTVTCSSGTYVRTLIDDIGSALGTGATMTALERTAVGRFSLENSVTIEELEALEPEKVLISVNEALSDYPEIKVTEAQGKRFHNGGALSLERVHYFDSHVIDLTGGIGCKPGLMRVLSPKGEFLGLGRLDEAASEIAVERVYVGR